MRRHLHSHKALGRERHECHVWLSLSLDVLYKDPPVGLQPESVDGPIQSSLALGSEDQILDDAYSLIERELCDFVEDEICQLMWEYTASALSSVGMDIIDSGASFHYCPGDRALSDTRPGVGNVRVANGVLEQISETGRYGPLENVQKVDSFHRMLVSVAGLTDRYNRVVFDNQGVSVVSDLPGGKTLRTRIGARTPSRLYSYDASALSDHNDKLFGS